MDARHVPTILENPRYTGRQVWNRQRTDTELADPGNVTLGHKSVQRWNLPDGWVISSRPAHPALVGEDDFVAAQGISATRGPVPQAELVLRRYLLAGLLACGVCGRRMNQRGPAASRRTGAGIAVPARAIAPLAGHANTKEELVDAARLQVAELQRTEGPGI